MTEPLNDFDDEQIAAWRYRAAAQFFDALHTYSAPGPVTASKRAERMLEPTYKALRELTDEMESRGLNPPPLQTLNDFKVNANERTPA